MHCLVQTTSFGIRLVYCRRRGTFLLFVMFVPFCGVNAGFSVGSYFRSCLSPVGFVLMPTSVPDSLQASTLSLPRSPPEPDRSPGHGGLGASRAFLSCASSASSCMAGGTWRTRGAATA